MMDRTEVENIIEAVELLHSLCTPAADIAKQVDIDQATTEHVIQYGRLPQRQLCLAWADEPEVSR